MKMSTAIQIIALVISAVTLAYLIKYVGATEIIARQSVRQVEATFRPALVCVPGRTLDDGPTLVNIGRGPAMEIEWHFSTTRDRIPYLVAELVHHPLRHFPGMKPLFETPMPIVFNYKSISGASYCSVCTYNVDRGEFSTTFSG
jgi:hypothetical protein